MWFDRVSMPSRALTFLQEIRDAISARDRLVLVVGPDALASEYVEAEWRWAFDFGKPVNPVLRLGDYDTLPEELKLLDAPDFTKDADYEERLATLVRQLSEPVPPMGKLAGVPSLPQHLLKGADCLR
ncbi:MAG: toll/interleukin-1 receptor domain-containing protein, partial [Armatimonadota bacterium]